MNRLFILLLFTQFVQGHLFIGVVDRIEGSDAVVLAENRNEEVIIKNNIELETDEWYLFFRKEEEICILSPLTALQSEMKSESENLMEELRNKQTDF